MTTRKYSSRSQQTTLTAALTSSGTSATVVSGTALLGGTTISAGETFTVVLDPDTALEEIVDVTAVSTNTLTITRGIDGSTGQAHSAGAVVRHMAIGRDYREANTHIEATTGHGATGAVVGTTNTQTLTNKTLTTPTITSPTITGTGAIAGTFTGNLTGNVTGNVTGSSGSTTGNAATATALATGRTISLAGDVSGTSASFDGTANASITVAYAANSIVNDDINASAAIALSKLATDPLARANHTGTQAASTISDFDTQVRTSRLDQMAAPTGAVSANSQKITNLGTPTSNTDASTKAYVDTSIANLIDGAPATLDTLNEIAAAIADNASFADSVVLKSGSTMSGALAMGTNKITGLGDPTSAQDAATKNYIDTLSLAPSNLTGPITSVGNVTSVASQTGTGSQFVMSTSPTITTPIINGIGAGTSSTNGVLWSGIGVGTISIGSGITSGSISIAANTALSGSVNIANGAGTTSRTVNIATAATGGTTTVNIGSTAGATSNVTISGTAIPVSKTLVATDSTEYVVPSQTGNSGKYLTTNGTVSSWGVVDALPSQTGNAGKYLTTNGTTASWETVTTDPTADIFMMMGA